jgi:hypothetical protein
MIKACMTKWFTKGQSQLPPLCGSSTTPHRPRKEGSLEFEFPIFLSDDSDDDLSTPEIEEVQKEDECIASAPLDPTWKPFAAVPDQDRKSILSRILRHGASLSTPGITPLRHGQSIQQFRASLALVSREFNVSFAFSLLFVFGSRQEQELATPYLYEAPMLTRLKALLGLSQSGYIHHVKFLWLLAPHPLSRHLDFLRALYALLPRCGNLVLVSEVNYARDEDDLSQGKPAPLHYQWSNFVSAIHLNSTALTGLANNCAGSLRHLHLNQGLAKFKGQKDFTRVLNALGQLRELRSLTVCGKFQSVGDLTKVDVTAERFPSNAFPHLERLVIDPYFIINKVFLFALCSARWVSALASPIRQTLNITLQVACAGSVGDYGSPVNFEPPAKSLDRNVPFSSWQQDYLPREPSQPWGLVHLLHQCHSLESKVR